jgi:hypothetical protein
MSRLGTAAQLADRQAYQHEHTTPDLAMGDKAMTDMLEYAK